tara:strand:+ start:14904 stop:16751 length:1848 start_codon:yes stop_codon:yes gene_type:complete
MSLTYKDYVDRCREDFVFWCQNEARIRTPHTASGRIEETTLKPNDAQLDFIEDVFRQMKERGFVRSIILKSRKHGFSTIIQALKIWMCKFVPNTEALTVAHQAEPTRYLFGIGQRITSLCDESCGAHVTRKARGNRLEFSNGSTAECRTQGGSADKERGTTPTFLHISELPSWESARKNTSAADVAQALLNAVPDSKGTMVFIESTAKGVGNLFYRIWKRAERKERGNVFVPLFFTWTGRDEFSVPAQLVSDGTIEILNDKKMKDAWRAGDSTAAYECSKALNYTSEEMEVAIKHNLSPSQMRWRRRTLANKCDLDIDRFHEEYPITPDEAFVASGRPFFLTRKVVKRLESLEDYRPMVSESMLVKDDASMMPRFSTGAPVGGGWEVYKKPAGGHRYIASSDSADGGTSKEDDFSCIQVLDRKTGELVAEFLAKVPPDILAHQLAYISMLYNNALCAPERNQQGHTTVHTLRTEHPDRPIYRAYTGPSTMPSGEEFIKNMGWRTKEDTRAFMMDELSKRWRRDEITIYSKRFLGQMLTFHRDKTSGKPQHVPGEHDDAIIAGAIAVAVDALMEERGEPAMVDTEKVVTAPVGATMVFDGRCPSGLDPAESYYGWF